MNEHERLYLEEHPSEKPFLMDAVGKFLIVSQFSQPRWDPDEPRVWNWSDIPIEWWHKVRPSLVSEPDIRWGQSTWKIEQDGNMRFVGANYDSSG